MLGARLAVPNSQRIPTLRPVPNARHAAMQRWLPCLSNSARASPARAQPENPAFHHHRHQEWLMLLVLVLKGEG